MPIYVRLEGDWVNIDDPTDVIAGKTDWDAPVDVDAAAAMRGTADVTATGTGGSLTGTATMAGSSAVTAIGNDSGEPSAHGGYTWDQTHIDTTWVDDAEAADSWTIHTVDTLAETGTGSLNEAFANCADGQDDLIVFEVGGTADYTSWRTDLTADNVYIAGQTAPEPGYIVNQSGLRLEGHRQIVKHTSWITGDATQELQDNAGASRCVALRDDMDDQLIDHCLFAWAQDTNVNFRRGGAPTPKAMINSMTVEPLNESYDPESPHGYSVIIQTDTNVDFIGNLVSHGWKRNPAVADSTPQFFWTNNYIYNPGARVYHENGGDPPFDWLGNVVHAGTDTSLPDGIFDDENGDAYMGDTQDFDEHNLRIPGGLALGDAALDYLTTSVYTPAGFDFPDDMHDPADLEQFMIDVAGPHNARRHTFAQDRIDHVVNETGRIVSSPDHAADYPAREAYPDYAETSHTLNPPATNVITDWLDDWTAWAEDGASKPAE